MSMLSSVYYYHPFPQIVWLSSILLISLRQWSCCILLVTFNLALTCLNDLCRPVSGTRCSCPLRSAERDGLLSVPVSFARTTFMESRACSAVIPTIGVDLGGQPGHAPPNN